MVFCLCVRLGITCMSYLRRPKEGSDPLVAELQSLLAGGGVVVEWEGVTWELSPDPLLEQPMSCLSSP